MRKYLSSQSWVCKLCAQSKHGRKLQTHERREMTSSISSPQKPSVTLCCLSWPSDLIRSFYQMGGWTWTNNTSSNWGLQTAIQPAAAVEVGVAGLHCPPLPPSFSSIALHCFSGRTISKLLRSAASARCRSALCALGEGSSAGRETAGTVTSTAARSPFWKGYLVTDILFSIWLGCIITL